MSLIFKSMSVFHLSWRLSQNWVITGHQKSTNGGFSCWVTQVGLIGSRSTKSQRQLWSVKITIPSCLPGSSWIACDVTSGLQTGAQVLIWCSWGWFGSRHILLTLFKSTLFPHHTSYPCWALGAFGCLLNSPSEMVPADSSPLWNLRCWCNSETSPLAPQLLCTWKIFSFHLKESFSNEKKKKKGNFICKQTPRSFSRTKTGLCRWFSLMFPFQPAAQRHSQESFTFGAARNSWEVFAFKC